MNRVICHVIPSKCGQPAASKHPFRSCIVSFDFSNIRVNQLRFSGVETKLFARLLLVNTPPSQNAAKFVDIRGLQTDRDNKILLDRFGLQPLLSLLCSDRFPEIEPCCSARNKLGLLRRLLISETNQCLAQLLFRNFKPFLVSYVVRPRREPSLVCISTDCI
ncbi:hypothetical protein PC120_g8955 [Phytophthora cactorum]|nr:hypothetical protein PC120_g8955 [Phytophthora cactorum]